VRIFEPSLALDGGEDGLNCYKIIAKQAQQHLKQNGKIFLEIGYNQERPVTEIFRQHNFKLESSYRDLGNIVRVVSFSN
jgi:release factor glutamine methyltransferase